MWLHCMDTFQVIEHRRRVALRPPINLQPGNEGVFLDYFRCLFLDILSIWWKIRLLFEIVGVFCMENRFPINFMENQFFQTIFRFNSPFLGIEWHIRRNVERIERVCSSPTPNQCLRKSATEHHVSDQLPMVRSKHVHQSGKVRNVHGYWIGGEKMRLVSVFRM